MIDSERMHDLACAYADSRSDAALSAAAEACLPLCAVIARRFSGRGVDYDDLYQTAALACVRAIRDFDPARGLRFSTYVTPTVTGVVRNYLRDKASTMRAPRGMAERAARLQKARETLARALHREPTAREIAGEMGIDVAEVLDLLVFAESRNIKPLEHVDDDGLSVAERVGGDDAGFERFAMREDLKQALARLSGDEKTLLAFRFDRRMTQRETAREMGLSQMQVSRMERRVIAALRGDMEAL